MSKKSLFVCILAGGLLPLWVANAQVVSGRLSGSVVDATNSPVPGAKVTLSLPDGSGAAILQAETTSIGTFAITGVRVDTYDVSVEKDGFRKQTQHGASVNPGAETVLAAIRLEVGSVVETIEVTESLTSVQTNNAEVATTVTREQVATLPLLDRAVAALFQTQVGVTNGRGPTSINGQRTTFTSVSMDGVNIQDNLFRENGVDFQPQYLTLDQVSEFTVFTSNTNASVGGGSSQVVLATRSGSNAFHGAGFWYNRNNATAANDWFANRDGLENPFLNQNQVGGNLGGPILKNKLLFYGAVEGFRRRERALLQRTILTGDARQGILTYTLADGSLRKANLLQLAGVGADPTVASQVIARLPGVDKINNFRRGDSSATALRNSAGYSFLAGDKRNRDNVTSKVDFYASATNHIYGSYLWNRESDNRNDAGVANDFSIDPAVNLTAANHLASFGWRSAPSSNFTNEVRGGFNRSAPRFVSSQQFGSYIIDAAYMRSGALLNNPTNTFRDQGRDTNTYNFSDNASYIRGRHSIQFGFQAQRVYTSPFNDGGITARYDLAIGAGNPGLTAAALPGISQNDLTTANNLLSLLAGYTETYAQTFNVTSRTSGFVRNATNRRDYYLPTYGFYVQDSWKMHPRINLTLGLRYDMFGVVDERNSLAVMPVHAAGANPIATVTNPNGVLDFAGSSAGRPYYNRDRNDFAPNIGLAWDVFGTGKTAIRAGYTVSYVNDNHIAAMRNSAETAAGLSTLVQAAGLTGRVSTNLPPVPQPTFQMPRTFAQNYALDSQTAYAMPDPNLRTPYVQQWNFGIQQQIKGNVVEVRYLGHHGVKLFRGLDYNQVVIKENGFLDDFNRAFNNGVLARAATGTFNPNYNANISGSQPLTVFSRLPNGGNLLGAANNGFLQRGEVGELANQYQITRQNGPVNFYRNPNGLGNNLMTNYSNSSFNAFQVDFSRRLKAGVQLQANYGFSKVLSDGLGDGQLRFDAFLDAGNGKIERARAPFDLRHQFKANGVWLLPFGDGHRLGMRGINWLIGGWSIGSILTWQSGTPFSVLSSRGTLNRQGRSLTTNTANTSLTGEQLDDSVGFFMTGNGPRFISPSAIGTDGRGTAADGLPAFNGQAFSNPAAGTLGTLQRRRFSGPTAFNLDSSALKEVKIGERQSIQIRAEFVNVLNHATFDIGDETVAANRPRFDINSTTFGQITGTFFDRRIMQFGLYYRF